MAPSSSSSSSSSRQVNGTALVLNANSDLGNALTDHLLAHHYHVIISHSNLSLGLTLSATTGPNASFLAADLSSWPSTVSLFQRANAWFTSKSKTNSQNLSSRSNDRGIDVLIVLPPEHSPPDGDNLLGELLAPNVRRENDQLQLEMVPSSPPNTSAVTEAVTGLLWATRMFASLMDTKAERPRKVVVFSDGAELSGVPGMPVYGASTHAIVGLTRSLGAGLKAAADIELNCVLSAFVRSEYGTTSASVANVMSAMDVLLGDEKECWTAATAGVKNLSGECTGQVLEVAMKGLHWRRQADWPDEEQRWMGEERVAFYEATSMRSQI